MNYYTSVAAKPRIKELMGHWKQWCGHQAYDLEWRLEHLMDQPASDLTWEEAMLFSRLAFLVKVSDGRIDVDDQEFKKQACTSFMAWLTENYPEDIEAVSSWRDTKTPIVSGLVHQSYTFWKDLHLVLFGLDQL